MAHDHAQSDSGCPMLGARQPYIHGRSGVPGHAESSAVTARPNSTRSVAEASPPNDHGRSRTPGHSESSAVTACGGAEAVDRPGIHPVPWDDTIQRWLITR